MEISMIKKDRILTFKKKKGYVKIIEIDYAENIINVGGMKI